MTGGRGREKVKESEAQPHASAGAGETDRAMSAFAFRHTPIQAIPAHLQTDRAKLI